MGLSASTQSLSEMRINATENLKVTGNLKLTNCRRKNERRMTRLEIGSLANYSSTPTIAMSRKGRTGGGGDDEGDN